MAYYFIMPDGYELGGIKKTKHCDIVYFNKKKNGTFKQVNIKTNGKDKVPKKKETKISVDVNGDWNEVSIDLWKPKHVIQYMQLKNKEVFDKIPLELKWSFKDNKNVRERTKSLAYAKRLLDKFKRARIDKNKLKEYIDWCFTREGVFPSMALVSCDNWIDTYSLTILNGRNKKSKLNPDDDWKKQVDKLND